MPKLRFSLVHVVRELENGSRLVEPLLFPEILCLGNDRVILRAAIARRVAEVIRDTTADNLYRRRLPTKPQVEKVEIAIEPPRNSLIWREKVSLQFSYIVWKHGNDGFVAFVPELNIEIVADDRDKLAEQIPKHIRAALARMNPTGSLYNLLRFERTKETKIVVSALTVDVRAPKQMAREAAEKNEKQAGILKETATDLTKETLPPAYELDAALQQFAELLNSRQPKSVLLAGPSGVGKTALFHELVRRRAEFQLANTPFWSTTGSRLIAGASGFGMWQERCQKLVREMSRTKAVLHLGNLPELIEIGKGGGNQQGIAAFLRSYIASGEIVTVAECTGEELLVIERADPQLLASFHVLRVAEPSDSKSLLILYEAALAFRQHGIEGKGRAIPLETAALDELDHLHRRYATYSAFPGRPLRFLRNLLLDYHDEKPLSAAFVTDVFSRETGLPRFMLDPTLPMRPEKEENISSVAGEAPEVSDLSSVQQWFSQHIIGQSSAVNLVVNLLATVKAGMTRAGKPIASLLFIGPTGVGKTEMAKTLCRFLYRDAARMVRFDMSEYADPWAVARLISGTGKTQGLLTAKVREQPFTVVLLDELEKAHPSFFDLLLQILGEGRLTDSAGRIADFRNCVVVMTSNLGAESYERGRVGFADSGNDVVRAEEHFTRKVREFFRPELFNRIDHIIPFAPLSQPTIETIARRELDAVTQRDGLRFRRAKLEIAEDVTTKLAVDGYHIRYGARPLKRTVEQQLVAPLAEQLNRYDGDLPVEATVTLVDGNVRTTVRPVLAAKQIASNAMDDGSRTGLQPNTAESKSPLVVIDELLDVRRKIQTFERSSTVSQIRNQIARLEQMRRQFNRQLQHRRRHKFGQFPHEAQLGALNREIGMVTQLCSEAFACEDETLLAWHQRSTFDATQVSQQVTNLRERLIERLMETYLREVGDARLVTIVVFSEEPMRFLQLVRAYDQVAEQRGFVVQRYHLTRYREDIDPDVEPSTPSGARNKKKEIAASSAPQPSLRLTRRERTAEGEEQGKSIKVVDAYYNDDRFRFYNHLMPGTIGVALQVQGAGSFMYFAGETGLHEFKRGTRTDTCWVESNSGLLVSYVPPQDIHRRGTIATLTESKPRRTYTEDPWWLNDPQLGSPLAWSPDQLGNTLGLALEQYVMAQAWKALEQ